jgi:hypothetical protein
MVTMNADKVPLLYKGAFDFHAIYHAVLDWFAMHECWVYEELYKDKVSGPDITEKDIKLFGEVRIDEFVMWNCTINIRVWDAKILDQRGPSGHKLIQGRLEVLINGQIITDYQQAFEGDGLATAFRKIVNKLTSRGTVSTLFGQYYGRTYMLQGTCKKILGMSTATGYDG